MRSAFHLYNLGQSFVAVGFVIALPRLIDVVGSCSNLKLPPAATPHCCGQALRIP